MVHLSSTLPKSFVLTTLIENARYFASGISPIENKVGVISQADVSRKDIAIWFSDDLARAVTRI